MKDKMTVRTKCRAIENDKWERMEYLKESNSGTIKDIVTITSHMQEVKANYGRKGRIVDAQYVNQKRIIQTMS